VPGAGASISLRLRAPLSDARPSLALQAYYGYLWSEVFAADLYESLFAADPLDAVQGLRYRRILLGAGGSRDAADFLRDLLGREPSNAAFLRQKGLKPAAAAAAPAVSQQA
jgi:hypothetical protein